MQLYRSCEIYFTFCYRTIVLRQNHTKARRSELRASGLEREMINHAMQTIATQSKANWPMRESTEDSFGMYPGILTPRG